MNENNRRGGGVFVTAEPRKDADMEIHQLHKLIAINSIHGGCFSWLTDTKRLGKHQSLCTSVTEHLMRLQWRIRTHYVCNYREQIS